MTSLLAGPDALLRGVQEPRIFSAPPHVSSSGDEAIECAQMAGLFLDPWQELALRVGLGERADHKWSAFEVAVVGPRQNGKDGVLEARELTGLFVLSERLIVHTAHLFDTSLEHFLRLLQLIEGTPDFDRRVQKVSRSHGEEGIVLKKVRVLGRDGHSIEYTPRIRFRTRTKGGGRGFSADCVILNEAMELGEATVAALLPTLSTIVNPQLWYAASAVNQEIHDNGVALARIRERGISGQDRSLAYCEWSAEGELDGLTAADIADEGMWAQANPALGIRISRQYIENEMRTMSVRNFAVERLGIGDWPDTSEDADRVIPVPAWLECAEHDSSNRVTSVPTFAIDANMDSTWASVGVAGARGDGLPQGAVLRHDRGTDWVVTFCVELRKLHRRSRVVVDAGGPARHLIPALKEARIRVLEASMQDYGDACADFVAAIVGDRERPGGQFRYPFPQPELDDALANARKASLGDRWKWSRKDSASADISPLVAVTLAYWGHCQAPARARVVNLNDYV